MRTFIYIAVLLASASIANRAFAQTVNWRSVQPVDKHIVNLNAGWDYSSSFGIGYGYKLNSKLPIVIGTEFSLPSGQDRVDDLKTKIGAQAEVFRTGNFSATIKLFGVFRRYESEFVRLVNFGSEFSATLGYFKPKWYAAGEFGFDKSIVTHVKHSSVMEEYYPEIRSGWYIPTGGNFSYGIQAGYSLKSYDIYVKAGKTLTQDFKTTAGIPYYVNLGFNKRF